MTIALFILLASAASSFSMLTVAFIVPGGTGTGVTVGGFLFVVRLVWRLVGDLLGGGGMSKGPSALFPVGR